MKNFKTRIYINKLISSSLLIYIKDKQHHFLKNVLRIKINDKIIVFDGKTGEWEAVVISVNRDNVVVRVIKLNKKIKNPNDIWLIFSPIKQNRMSIAIQKATELGVSKIIPCFTEFTNIKKINLQNIKDNSIEAAEQCGRMDLPIIEKQTSINDLLLNWPDDRKIIFCDEKIENNKSILETLYSYKNALNKSSLLIGPEGGFSNSEREILKKNKN
jgi:RNA methyltransferase, RsmE family